MLHRPWRARDFDAVRFEALAGGVDVGHADRQVAETLAQRVRLLLPPVVGELDHRFVGFVAVADEGQRELAAGILLISQQLHAEQPSVEIDRFVEVEHADHGVQ